MAWGLLVASALAYLALTKLGRTTALRVAAWLTAASWGLLTAGLIQRGLAAGHWPFTNRYEYALCLVWAIMTIYLLLTLSWLQRGVNASPNRGLIGVLWIALLVAAYAILRPADERVIVPLLPALRSPWYPVHVFSTLVAYGAFGVAAGLGVVRLVSGRPTGAQPDQGELASSQLSPREIERTMERSVALGFPWLTLGILAGAIWAQNAWARYWDWDPKETWALITWLWYVMVLHLCSLPGWRGRRLAGLVVAGFGLVFFTFAGVPWLVRTVRLESLHGF